VNFLRRKLRAVTFYW